ncbi:MAG: PAS domain-containing protein, partial [Armatimonadota bacterium]
LNRTHIITVFLDKELKIRSFTPQITEIINLQQSDIGRPVTDFATGLANGNLIQDIEKVLDTLVSKEEQVQTQDNHWYLMRIVPYQTIEKYIDGVVITFTEISSVKILESEREARKFAESIVATVREPLVILDPELRIISASRSFYQTFQTKPEETEGKFIYDLGDGQWNLPELRKFLEEILPKSNEFHDYRVEHEFPNIGHKMMLLNGQQIYADTKRPQIILLAIEDITDR